MRRGENQKEKRKKRELGLNKAVGFSQSSRKSKWAQSQRPGGGELTGRIVSRWRPTDSLRLFANMRRAFCPAYAGARDVCTF